MPKLLHSCMDTIPAFSDTVESEGRQIKQFWIMYYKNPKVPPLKHYKKFKNSFNLKVTEQSHYKKRWNNKNKKVDRTCSTKQKRTSIEGEDRTNCTRKNYTITKCILYTVYVPRVPQCLSPRWDWDPPSPLRLASVPWNQRGGYTLACVWGGGGPNSDDWRES